MYKIDIMSNDTASVNAFLFNAHNIQFLFGIFSAIIVRRGGRHYVYLLIGVFMLMAFIVVRQLLFIEYVSSSMLTVYLGCCFMFFVTGLCSIEEKVTYPETLFFLGTASYSIYLIHNPAISLLNRIAQKIYFQIKLPSEIFFFFVAILSIMLGIAYYFLWEKPSLEYLKSKFLVKGSQVGPLE